MAETTIKKLRFRNQRRQRLLALETRPGDSRGARAHIAKRHTFCLSAPQVVDGAKRLRSVLVSPPSDAQFNNLDCGGQGAEAPAGASSLDPRRFFTSAWARTYYSCSKQTDGAKASPGVACVRVVAGLVNSSIFLRAAVSNQYRGREAQPARR